MKEDRMPPTERKAEINTTQEISLDAFTVSGSKVTIDNEKVANELEQAKTKSATPMGGSVTIRFY
ncbi:hypothetical protein BCCGELA001_05210 [Bradyrhizobium sp. CCGE-LA001]|nr:hypothetical protein BCCGELA001_05210 [Bradyrhizobium sp. CCGE-LA001]